MKKIFSFCIALVCVSVVCAENKPTGLTCEDAIPVDTSYTGTIDAAGTYYYSAWTYDLPLTCRFYPTSEVKVLPYIDVDFSCVNGQYDDPNIVEMLDATSGWGIQMPMRFTVEKKEDENGGVYYALTVSEFYRAQMANFGITYNVKALIKLVTENAGTVTLKPDTTFQSCINNSHWVDLPDTLPAGVAYTDRVYAMPFADWVNDSIRFRWTGTTSPVRIWLGTKCDFEPQSDGDNPALDYISLYPNEGNNDSIIELNKEMLQMYLSFLQEAGESGEGIFYARVVSAENATLIIDRKPMSEIMAQAKLLEYDKPVDVLANDVEQLYYFPKKWANQRNLLFSASPDAHISAYVGKEASFAADKTDDKCMGVYAFHSAEAGGAELGLSKPELQPIYNQIADMEDFIYVRFESDQDVSLTPTRWAATPCIEKSEEISTTDSCRLPKESSLTPWRIHYAQWSRQDMQLCWKGWSDLKMYISDTCSYSLTSTNKHVLKYALMTLKTDGTCDTLTITQTEMAQWAESVDADGYLYVRFANTQYGDLFVMPKPTQPTNPTAIENTADASWQVQYVGNTVVVTTTTDQTFTLYSALGSVLRHWTQPAGTTEEVLLPTSGVYVLKGVEKTMLIRK